MKARGAVRVVWAALLAVVLVGLVPGGVAWGADPGVEVRFSSSQVVTTNPQVILWNTETKDDDGYHSMVTATGRLTVPTGLGGRWFSVSLWTEYSNGGGTARFRVQHNGSLVAYVGTGQYIAGLNVVLWMADGDYVEASITGVTSGSVVNTDVVSRFAMAPLGGAGAGSAPCPTWAPTPTPTPTPSPTPTEGPCTVQVIGFAGTAADTLNLLLVAVVTVGALGLFLLGALAVAAAFRR